MNRCPRCNAILPNASTYCQFCNSTMVSGPPPPPPPPAAHQRRRSRGEYAWGWKAYYGVAGWWMLNGVYQIWRGGNEAGLSSTLDLGIGALTCVVAIGLVFRVEFVRAFVNFVAFMQILSGVLGILFMFLMGASASLGALFGLLFMFVQIGAAVLMVFVIGETESHGPNW